MHTLSTAILQSSSGQKNTINLRVKLYVIVSSTVGMSDVLGGMVDTNHPLLLSIGHSHDHKPVISSHALYTVIDFTLTH